MGQKTHKDQRRSVGVTHLLSVDEYWLKVCCWVLNAHVRCIRYLSGAVWHGKNVCHARVGEVLSLLLNTLRAVHYLMMSEQMRSTVLVT